MDNWHSKLVFWAWTRHKQLKRIILHVWTKAGCIWACMRNLWIQVNCACFAAGTPVTCETKLWGRLLPQLNRSFQLGFITPKNPFPSPFLNNLLRGLTNKNIPLQVQGLKMNLKAKNNFKKLHWQQVKVWLLLCKTERNHDGSRLWCNMEV